MMIPAASSSRFSPSPSVIHAMNARSSSRGHCFVTVKTVHHDDVAVDAGLETATIRRIPRNILRHWAVEKHRGARVPSTVIA
jgi:hypothetical protein